MIQTVSGKTLPSGGAQLWLLFRTQLRNTLRLDEWKENTGRRKSRFLFLALAYVLVGVMLLGYCYLLGAGLGTLGLSGLIPMYALTVSGLMTLFFTFLKANGVLFGCRDYELLTALPVPTWAVITSRFLIMYLFNSVFSLAVMAAMGAAWAPYVGNPLSWVFWIAGIFLACLIPTTLATLTAVLVAAVSSRFRHSNAINIVISLVFLLAVLGFSFRLGMVEEEQLSAAALSSLGEQLATILARVYPPSVWFGRAVTEGSAGSMALFTSVSLGLYLVFAWILAAFYQKIQNALTSHKTARRYQVGHLKGRSPLRALYIKEWKGFLASPTYVMNMGVGAILAVLAAAIFCFTGPEALMGSVGVPGIESVFNRAILFIPVILLPMSNTACVSLSLEGKHLWILKSSPVSLMQIFNSKILVTLIIGLPAGAVTNLLLWLRLRPSVLDAAAMLLLTGVMVCFAAVCGIWINLKFPVYEWENQTQVVKQSAASFCGLFGGVIVGIVLAFAAVKLSRYPLWLIGGGQGIGMAAITFLFWRGLNRVRSL